ncbi:phage major capsid protein [Pannus brasiliensis CCIBt3594]|uniref:Phage major capsid protein n=1 Tax=Pannus brasiliensis CCIBt3594 TaxID=1427578 RepID=A0AAW9QUG6_9CHRO
MVATQVKAPETGKIFTREFTAKVRAVEGSSDRITFSFSSEEPVDRWWYREILSHEPGAFDLSRVSGMNWLWNHKMDVVLGKVERIWLGDDKRLYAETRWSKKPSVQDFRIDVEDGILTNMSFGYSVEEYQRQAIPAQDDVDPEEDDIDEECPTYIGTKWKIYEISLVSVPADSTVGIGRALSEFTIEERRPTQGGIEVSEAAVLEERAKETNRVREILAAAEFFHLPDLGQTLVEKGTSIEEAYKIFRKEANPEQNPVATPIDLALGLKNADQQEYSIRKAILAAAYGRSSTEGREAGREWEYSDEIAKRIGKSKPEKSIFIPVRDLKVFAGQQQRASLIAGDNQFGGFTIDTELRAQDFIDLLRNQAKVMMLGATLLTGLEGPVNIPRQASAGQAFWLGEEASITPSRLGFNQVGLRYKTVGARQSYTRDLMYQSSLDIEMLIRMDLAMILALAIDKAALWGTGMNNEPRGIANTAGVNSIDLGTNGGELTWFDVVNAIKLVKKNNAAIGAISWLGNAEVEAKLMTTPKQADGVEGNFILSEPGMMAYPRLCGYRFETSEQIPSDLEKGTGINLSGLVAGVFSQVVIGQWGVLEIEANPYSGEVWPKGAFDVRAMQSADVTLRHEESFTVFTDIVTA